MVAIAEANLKLDHPTYEILKILGISMLDKTPIRNLFTKIEQNNPHDINQLEISFLYKEND